MFILDYVYVPLWGKAYVASDVCESFIAVEYSDKEMRLELTHSAYDMNRQEVKFQSFVVIPKQRVTVRELKEEEIYPGRVVNAGKSS